MKITTHKVPLNKQEFGKEALIFKVLEKDIFTDFEETLKALSDEFRIKNKKDFREEIIEFISHIDYTINEHEDFLDIINKYKGI